MTLRVAVLGGGVAGVTVANELAQRGVQVDLFEGSSRLGGLHRTITVDGYAFDIGAFVFSTGHELLRSFPFLYDHFVSGRPRYARITPRGSLDVYPMSIGGYLADEGIVSSAVAAVDLLVSKWVHRRKDTVPAYAKYFMGGRVYRKSGLRNYVERLYGLPDSEVGLEFAMQRLQMLERYTPRYVVETRLRRIWNRLSTAVGAEVPSGGLVRPALGFDFVYSLIEAHLKKLGVHVSLEANLQSVRPSEGGGFELEVNGRRGFYDRVVSTIPIPAAQKLAGIDPGNAFETMSLYSLFYRGKLRHDNAIQYNFTLAGKWKRITVFSKYYGEHEGDAYWTVEITTRDTTPESLHELRLDYEQHAASIGLHLGRATYVGEAVTDYAYPIFRRGYTERMRVGRDKLTKLGIDCLGRQGAFEYLSSLQVAGKARELSIAVSGAPVRAS